jgi:hypothetical protein
MHPAHVAVSAACLLCGSLAVLGLTYEVPAMVASGVYFGYFATISAVLVGLFIGGSAVARALSNAAKPYLARHWLALLNSGVSAAFYAIVIASHGN